MSKRLTLNRILLYAALAVALAALPFVVDATLGRAWVRIIDVALLFVMLALGLNIVVGFAGLLDLGYIAFFAVGAYSYALLASPQFGIHWSFLALLPLGGLWDGRIPTSEGCAERVLKLQTVSPRFSFTRLAPRRTHRCGLSSTLGEGVGKSLFNNRPEVCR